MSDGPDPWRLTDDEWDRLRPILEDAQAGQRRPGRGRPRIQDIRPLAEACLYRYFHCLSTGRSHAFNWNALPAHFGVGPSTANRRFREWHDSGAWFRFWEELLKLRGPGGGARGRGGHGARPPTPPRT